MKKLLLILFLTLVADISYTQAIIQLDILDGNSLPLAPGDDGIKFQYQTTYSGLLSAYLKTNSEDYKLFSNIQEFKGIGYIVIQASKLLHFYTSWGLQYQDITLQLAHIGSNTNKYSYKELLLKMNVEAPYGYELEDYPTKPLLYPTNITKEIFKPLPFVCTVAGGCILVAGIATEINSENNGKLMMAIGVLILMISYQNIYKYVPDTETNDLNKRLNQDMLETWMQEYDRAEAHNSLVKATFRIRLGKR
jgi:hypothetical protein